MTKEEIIAIYIEVSNKLCNGTEWCWAGVDEPLQLFAKLVAEKAIKEALAQPEQEPVAFASHGVVNWIADKQFQHEANLYIAPQRTWVGLTEEEMMDAIYAPVTPMERGRRVEAKLRSKNTKEQE